MIVARDFNSGIFLNASQDTAEDVDPRIGLVNLADVMLVFACGLMLALVSYWNLDMSNLQELVQNEQVAEVSDIEDLEGQLNGIGSGYQELGMVYKDPTTGKLYMLSEDLAGDESGSDSSSSGAALSSTNDVSSSSGAGSGSSGTVSDVSDTARGE